jgi:hypothetical protein
MPVFRTVVWYVSECANRNGPIDLEVDPWVVLVFHGLFV